MKILLAGVTNPHSASTLMEAGLVELGHECHHVNYRAKGWKGECDAQYDLAIVVKGTPQFTEKDADWVHARAERKFLFWPDTIGNWRPVSTYAVKNLGWHWSTTGSKVKEAVEKRTGSKKGARIIQGAMLFPGCEFPSWKGDIPEQEPAILFFGSMSPRRKALLKIIKERGIPVEHVQGFKYGRELQELVWKYPAVLGVNSTTDVISARCQTVLAMGGVMFQELLPDMATDYKRCPKPADGITTPVVGWRTPQELLHVITQAIILEKVAIWKDPGGEFAQWVRDQFCWTKKMQEVLDHAGLTVISQEDMEAMCAHLRPIVTDGTEEADNEAAEIEGNAL